jgi:hypothetical protein
VKSAPRGLQPGVPWTNADGAREADGAFATADLATGEETEELVVTDFGFSIPPDALVTGIEIELKRQAPSGGVTDGALHLVLDGAESPGSHTYDAAWPASIVGTHKYGTELDLWGMTLTSADVASPTFGAAIYAKKLDPGGLANVDAVRLFVNYCLP